MSAGFGPTPEPGDGDPALFAEGVRSTRWTGLAVLGLGLIGWRRRTR